VEALSPSQVVPSVVTISERPVDEKEVDRLLEKAREVNEASGSVESATAVSPDLLE
jgi:hypothetical protein